MTGVSVSGTVRAAGAVLWREGRTGVEVALVHRPRYDDWSLPKGKLDPGECEAAAAVREVQEETGARCALGRRLGTSRYQVLASGAWVPKTVAWWSARCLDGGFTAGREVDALAWLPVPDAAARLTAGRDREVLQAFTAHPAGTATVALVRHGAAGSRADWPGPDRQRPLDDAGRAQAAALAELLLLHGVRRVLSAPRERCVQTVQPLADRLGVPVEVEPLLGDDGHRADPEAALALVRALPDGTAACSQGDALPALLSALAGAPAARVRKGTGRVLSLLGGALVQSDPLAPLP